MSLPSTRSVRGASAALTRGRRPLLLGGLLVIVAVVMVWSQSHRAAIEHARQVHHEATIAAGFELSHQIQQIESAMMAGRALFVASQAVDRDEWESFVDELKNTKGLSGTAGFGVIRRVKAGEASVFVEHMR
ncbi:MAG: hypothetical protein AAGK04_12535, partial [Planctomycetota bacterium]